MDRHARSEYSASPLSHTYPPSPFHTRVGYLCVTLTRASYSQPTSKSTCCASRVTMERAFLFPGKGMSRLRATRENLKASNNRVRKPFADLPVSTFSSGVTIQHASALPGYTSTGTGPAPCFRRVVLFLTCETSASLALPSNIPVQRQSISANGTNGHGDGAGKIVAMAHRVTERARSLNGLMGSIGGPVECPMEITGLANSGPSQLDAHRWQAGSWVMGIFIAAEFPFSPLKRPLYHTLSRTSTEVPRLICLYHGLSIHSDANQRFTSALPVAGTCMALKHRSTHTPSDIVQPVAFSPRPIKPTRHHATQPVCVCVFMCVCAQRRRAVG